MSWVIETEMTVTFIEFLTTLLIVDTSVLCVERRLWSTADDLKYSYFDDRRRQEMLEETRHMFYFGYDSYMTHAFPKDELDPIHCTGRGPDYDNPYVTLLHLTPCGLVSVSYNHMDIFEKQDSRLFKQIVTNPQHCLNSILPSVRSRFWHARPRSLLRVAQFVNITHINSLFKQMSLQIYVGLILCTVFFCMNCMYVCNLCM